MPCLVLGSSLAKLSTLMGVRGGDRSYFSTLQGLGGPKPGVVAHLLVTESVSPPYAGGGRAVKMFNN